MCANICICVQIYVYLCKYMYMCANICICVQIYVYVCKYMYMCANICMCANSCVCVQIHVYVCKFMYVCANLCILPVCILDICMCRRMFVTYEAATISWLLKIKCLFCRIQSFLQGSFAKETYNFKGLLIVATPCVYAHMYVYQRMNLQTYEHQTHVYKCIYEICI